MKATGIVRRVDSLGRVVIPKEIRHTLRIREGSPLEIYTDKEGGVTFRKYSPLGDLQEFAGQVCDAIRSGSGCMAAICDLDTVVAVAGVPRRELVDKPYSRELEAQLEQRRSYFYTSGEPEIPVSEFTDRYRVGVLEPIVSQGDLIGCVLVLLTAESPQPQECHRMLLHTIADFLGRQMEG